MNARYYQAGMEKVNYYSRMTKQCIEKSFDIDYQELFPDISSTDSIRKMSDDKSDEEQSSSNDYTEYSDYICFVISKLWIARE